MLFRQIRDDELSQHAYLIGCPQTGEALLVDPERDVDRYLALVEREGLELVAVAETHIHADFLSGARELVEARGLRLYLSDEGGDEWRSRWARDAGHDVVFLRDGDTFRVGEVELRALHTPGHTPEHLSFLVTDRGGGADEPMGVITGDFVFVGDLGRPDLLESAARREGEGEPSARRLYGSARAFLELPEFLQVWPGHGAGSACGKALGAVPQSTVGYEKRNNHALIAAWGKEDAFVETILADQSAPPLYFGRMKRLNEEGVPVMGALPEVPRVEVETLARAAQSGEAVVLDTRPDRAAFMARHLERSQLAPLAKTFPTVVGSLVEDPERPIYLVVEEAGLERAVRSLVRIGYDRIAGYAAPDAVVEYLEEAGAASIERIDFEAVEARRGEPGVAVLDVRYAWEYDEAHVPGAVNVPYTRLPERLGDVPGAETLLVHCATGVRSAVASAFLARHGYDVQYVDDDFGTSAFSASSAAEP